jgi:hypothetical protein
MISHNIRAGDRSFHDLGECEVKHGVRIDVVNFYGDGIGNPQVPKRFQILQKHRAPMRWAVIATVVGAAALLAFQFARTRKPATAELPKETAPIAAQDKSVAVLPFENLSSDKENAFFAQGIQDEIITTLSRISGLRVISRTSTARYNSAPENLPEIAKQLHVTKCARRQCAEGRRSGAHQCAVDPGRRRCASVGAKL